MALFKRAQVSVLLNEPDQAARIRAAWERGMRIQDSSSANDCFGAADLSAKRARPLGLDEESDHVQD